MLEGSRWGDWVGSLTVVPDRGTIAAIEAVGPGASFLNLAWDAAAGMLTITPGESADYEAFLARGLVPQLTFSLRATMRTGRVETDTTIFTIALGDRDDTAPVGLGFAAGGSVVAGAIGAVIGTLRVTDPDTPGGGFRFILPEDEAWRFEVVEGQTLKLRDGITLGLDDIPRRPLVIGVSDGTQEAGFVLDLTVLDPDAPAPPPRLLAVGEARGVLGLPAPERALVLRGKEALIDLPAPQGGERPILLRGEADAALPMSTARIDFLDARLLLPGEGGAAAALALAGSATGRAQAVAAIDTGLALVEQAVTDPVLAGLRAASLAEGIAVEGRLAVAPMTEGPSADPVLVALHLARLASGESAAQVALDYVLMAQAPAAEPVWLPWSPGRQAPAVDAALAVPPLAPSFALDALLG